MMTSKIALRCRNAAAWLLLVLAIAPCASGLQVKRDSELQQTLQLMDAVRKTFRCFTARFSQTKYTAILKEFDTPDKGEFFYSRAKNGSVLLRQEATSPGKKILTVKDDQAIFYQPDIKQAQITNLGKYKNLAEYLAIGIGQSPAKLEESFNISYQGSESVNGAPCSILVLKPKSASVAARFSSITLWVKKSNGLPIQNKFLEPSGDYVLLTFLDEKLNVKIPESKYEQKLPSGVDIQRF